MAKSTRRTPRKTSAQGALVRSVKGGPTARRPNKTQRAARTAPKAPPSDLGDDRPTCTIVAIGASAGGLSAFKRFLAAMPADSGIALVLIPHLDPTHESLMVELLTKQTVMPVSEAAQGMTIEPNQVYIIPPNKYLAVSGGRLKLSKLPEPRGIQTAIDFCLQSLAADQKELAIGVILSGTGSHGSSGIREIKLAGGMVMAQSPESAEHDQMPRSAIATGLVDYVLAPEDMPEALVGYVQRTNLNGFSRAERADPWTGEDLNLVLAALKAAIKDDFRCYRRNMLARRVLRRMGLLHLDTPSDYVERLRSDVDEVERLRKDLLIGVTAFFREPEAFRALAEQALPGLIARTADRPLRAWVPGCATGEEAYSVAMALIEQRTGATRAPRMQIFGTDVDEQALAFARRGVYADNVVGGLSADRLRRFFVKFDSHHYEVSKQLRESIVFAPQNVLGDAPFSKLDLISCRNLLIYLQPDVQAKVIAMFHFALNKEGILFLGPSESIGSMSSFEPISKKSRLYRRVGASRGNLLEIPILPQTEHVVRAPQAPPARRAFTGYSELLRKTLLGDFAPASVLVNRHYEVLSVQGPAVEFLAFPPGEITKDLLAMARQGLRPTIRTACEQALREQRPIVAPARVLRGGKRVPCSIRVHPIARLEGETLLVVAFDDRPEAPAHAPPGDSPEAEQASFVRQLEDELRTTREELQRAIEELERSNEDLRAANEEGMSMNEELQSANEELETSREELQSLNEELSTVNSQLKDKVDELERANNDIINLIETAEIATVFLDAQLRIQRFTPPTARLLNLLATDVGRPLRDFTPKFADTALLVDCRRVLDRATAIEKEVRTDDGAYYLRRIIPYRAASPRIEGVVITFVNISERVAAEAVSRRLAAVLLDSNDAVLLQDLDGRVIAWNRGAERMYGYSEAEALQMNVLTLVPEHGRDEALDRLQRVTRGETIEPFEAQRLAHDGRLLDVWASATRLRDEAGQPVAVATTERDITQRKRNELQMRKLNATLERRVAERTAALEEREQKIRAIVETAPDGIITIDARGTIQTFNAAAEKMFGYTAKEVIGEHVKILVPALEHAAHDAPSRSRQTGHAAPITATARELTARSKDGKAFPIALSISEVDHLELFTGIIHDLSERAALQEEILNIATREQQRIGQDLHDGTQQALTGLGLLAQNLSDALQQQSIPERELAAKLASGIAAASREVRALATGLVPVPVHAEGLMTSLAELARMTTTRKLSCTFECPESVTLGDDLAATHLYRIAQEAVLNAVKHAKADRIEIVLKKLDSAVRLEVRDNGIGIKTPQAPNRGLGLRIMAYRCSVVGGAFMFGRLNNGGTIVACTFGA